MAGIRARHFPCLRGEAISWHRVPASPDPKLFPRGSPTHLALVASPTSRTHPLASAFRQIRPPNWSHGDHPGRQDSKVARMGANGHLTKSTLSRKLAVAMRSGAKSGAFSGNSDADGWRDRSRRGASAPMRPGCGNVFLTSEKGRLCRIAFHAGHLNLSV